MQLDRQALLGRLAHAVAEEEILQAFALIRQKQLTLAHGGQRAARRAPSRHIIVVQPPPVGALVFGGDGARPIGREVPVDDRQPAGRACRPPCRTPPHVFEAQAVAQGQKADVLRSRSGCSVSMKMRWRELT